jgi:D-beta-D-heptose 7-phosphate kinase/D-beta-D-heptose 1-phosphate adenosyltransferase
MSTLLEKLEHYQPFTVMLIGDVMLDQVVYGAAERLSPDAPVPILHATKSENRPGGAANVAVCLRALKGNVHVFGVVGKDEEGTTLRRYLHDAGCDVSGVLIDAGRPTTIKRSLVGLAQHRHPQKMFRVDMESREPLSEELESKLLAEIESRLAIVEIVILEDYAKGVCSASFCRRLVELCKGKNRELLVDPAAIDDYSKYRGATAVTPNRSEAELATGLDTPIDASELHNAGLASKLLRELDLEAVVLTLDRHGALLEVEGEPPMLVPTVARSVYDVTGAGDVVIAALAGARANGLEWIDAVKFANAAAGLEVEVFGAQPIPFARVQREVLRQQRGLSGKIRTLDELLVELAAHREAGHRVVLTNGCFDVVHAGHVAYLRQAKQLGDVLVVAINSDEEVRRQKGEGRPIYPRAERMEILAEFGCIDYVITFPEPTAHEIIRKVRPDVYAKGGDYAPEQINEIALLREMEIEVHVLAHRPGLGSRHTIEKLRATE